MFEHVNVISSNYFLYMLQKIMVMIRTPKRVTTNQQKDKVKTMVDNLVSIWSEFNV